MDFHQKYNKIYDIIYKEKLVTVNYLVNLTNFSYDDINNILKSNIFRKSYLKSSKGQDVYRLNTKYSFFIDIWESFKHINARKNGW